jgi:hypothetical protein
MLFLLDANTLIRANGDYYPISRIPHFWSWLIDCGRAGTVKIPAEIADEVTAGNDEVAEWLRRPDVEDALRLRDAIDSAIIQRVVCDGYAPNLTDAEVEAIGKDPFLIAYALAAPDRTIVTKERSRPSAQRGNRKVPDVCTSLGVRWLTAFAFYREADFRIVA